MSESQLLPEATARYFFIQFIRGLNYMHRNRVAHRDVKLSNVLLTSDDPPRIKICDFGLSKGPSVLSSQSGHQSQGPGELRMGIEDWEEANTYTIVGRLLIRVSKGGLS